MLVESFVASLLSSNKASNNDTHKDAGIFFHTYNPLPTLKSVFKKSSTVPRCLAVSSWHIFAAQADKAVVHAYNRERGNQEAIVPFPEKISSLAFIGDTDGAGILALGTEGGRVILWELCTGRQVSTPPAHLQAIACITVDPTANFLLTGSPDSNIHVWSIPALLSFSSESANDHSQPLPYSPVRTLSKHRAAINDLVIGHSSSSVNIAVSASQDDTCIVWDYRTGTSLHTFLLPSTPLCLALDPADRAFYVGYGDGSAQIVDFYKPSSLTHPIHDPSLAVTPTQPPPSDRWQLTAELASRTLCIEVSYDGTTLLTGHENGKIQIWNIAKGRYSTQLADFSPAAITNLQMLPPEGFPKVETRSIKMQAVIKPRYESSLNESSLCNTNSSIVPENYTFSAQFTASPALQSLRSEPAFSSHTEIDDLMASFDATLTHSSFPPALLEEGILALTTFTTTSKATHNFEEDRDSTTASFRAQLKQAHAEQRVQGESMNALAQELSRLQDEAKTKKRAKQMRRIKVAKAAERNRKRAMGEAVEMRSKDEETEEGRQDLSSSTDEIPSE